MRPDSLADDYTPIMPVLKYAVDEYQRRGRTFDQVWLLMACAPLIAAEDLVAAEKLFAEAGGQRQLLAVSEFQAPIEWALRREADGQMQPLQPGMFAVRSQDLEKRYFDAGSLAVDIDDERDWMLAEAIYRARAARHSSPGTA